MATIYGRDIGATAALFARANPKTWASFDRAIAAMRADDPASVVAAHTALWKYDPMVAAAAVMLGIHLMGEGDDPALTGAPVTLAGAQARQAKMIARDPSGWAEVLRLASQHRQRAVRVAEGWAGVASARQAQDAADRAYEATAGETFDKPKNGFVWAYHGTSSKFVPEIRRHGLTTGHAPSNFGSKGSPDKRQSVVFITTNAAGGPASALDYARKAAARHGGDPVVIRVRVPSARLGRDADDADLSVGRLQRTIGFVDPDEIIEIDGERTPAGERLYASGSTASVRANPTRDLHAFHVGHDRDGNAMYVVGDSHPGHRHDEYARMPSGRRALIVQRCGARGCDKFDVTVSRPGAFDTEHRSTTTSLNAAVKFAKRYG